MARPHSEFSQGFDEPERPGEGWLGGAFRRVLGLGVMVPGTYCWRPSMAPHGPMFTRDGALFFFRTKGGSWEVTDDQVPGWLELIAGYRVARPFFEPPGA